MAKNNPRGGSSLRSARAYMRFSGLAIQMGLLIAGGAFLGRWLDGRFGLPSVLTAVGALAGLALALFVLLRGLAQGTASKRSEDEQA